MEPLSTLRAGDVSGVKAGGDGGLVLPVFRWFAAWGLVLSYHPLLIQFVRRCARRKTGGARKVIEIQKSLEKFDLIFYSQFSMDIFRPVVCWLLASRVKYKIVAPQVPYRMEGRASRRTMLALQNSRSEVNVHFPGEN